MGRGFGFEAGKGGACRAYGWVDPAKDLVGIIFMLRTNGGGDVADEIGSLMAMAAAAIGDHPAK